MWELLLIASVGAALNLLVVTVVVVVSCSPYNLSFIIIQIVLTNVGLCTMATGNSDKEASAYNRLIQL